MRVRTGLSLLLAGLFQAQIAAAQCTFRVSVSSEGQYGLGGLSIAGDLSPDGRFVTFSSGAKNLVPDDTNDFYDVFVHDRQLGVTTRVSLKSNGLQANGDSYGPSISADGRFIAFESVATNLVTGDTNAVADIFVHDRSTHQTTRVSLGPAGLQSNGASMLCTLSADGLLVCFESNARNLVLGDTNSWRDVFVHDRATGVTQRVSVATGGAQSLFGGTYSDLSGDGRYVVFSSMSFDLVPGDNNGMDDVFIHDRTAGVTELVSVASNGTQANDHCYYASLSADGRVVAFESFANNLVTGDTNGRVDIFARDRTLGTTVRVSVASDGTQADKDCSDASVSPEGQAIAFTSEATTLVPGDSGQPDAFLHELVAATTERISVGLGGTQPDGYSHAAAVGQGGRWVLFESTATNLVPTGPLWGYDNYLRDRQGCQPTIGTYCTASTTSIPGCKAAVFAAGFPSVSAPAAFSVASGSIPGGGLGVAYFSVDGSMSVPFGSQGGATCVRPPRYLSGPHSSGGTKGQCDGQLTFTLEELMTAVPGVIQSGGSVNLAFWFRDPPTADHFDLSDALWFQVCP
jgi:Tol biopolymer transport system component